MTDKCVVLRGAHVIDRALGLDGVMDVVIEGGKIRSIGNAPADAEVIDLSGRYLTPGWIDIHVHVYGTLGFADPDSIGIYQGVTSFVDAGGPGIGTLDEFVALYDGQTKTSLYAGPYIRPMGIIGVDYVEGEARSIQDVPVARWLDTMAEHRDLIRYLKFGAFSQFGTGPLKLGKGLAEIIGLPIYVHIGEFQQQEGRASAYEIYRLADAGDIVTHVYHGNACGIFGDDGRLLPVVEDAARRGVLFDVGFGGFNFSWSIAEKAVGQAFLPQLISSDLQQFNVLGPVYSLANVMSVFLKLGLSLQEIVERVTINPAKALSLDNAGRLAAGAPADITVFNIENGDFTLTDTYNATRKADRRIVPEMAFKNGERVDCDMTRSQDERNWILQTTDERPPAVAGALSSAQRLFLRALADELGPIGWQDLPGPQFDLDKATALQDAFRRVQLQSGLSLKSALYAVFDSFLENPFKIPIGVLLMRVGRLSVMDRLREVSGMRPALAS